MFSILRFKQAPIVHRIMKSPRPAGRGAVAPVRLLRFLGFHHGGEQDRDSAPREAGDFRTRLDRGSLAYGKVPAPRGPPIDIDACVGVRELAPSRACVFMQAETVGKGGHGTIR